MAVVKGAARRNPKLVAAKQRWDSTRNTIGLNLGQIWCGWCKPGHWVRAAAWDQHYADVSFRIEQEREARKRAAQVAKTATRSVVHPDVQPPRPKNTKKVHHDGRVSHDPVTAEEKHRAAQARDRDATGKTDTGWTHKVCRHCGNKYDGGFCGCTASTEHVKNGVTNMSSSNGTHTPTAGGGVSAPDGVASAFRVWSMRVPPSIPAARHDAQAMADAYRQSADALRMRLKLEMEQNNLPENVLEPLQQAANALSRLGDLHMEVVRRLESRYGEVADVLSRPDTPDADYLKGGR